MDKVIKLFMIQDVRSSFSIENLAKVNMPNTISGLVKARKVKIFWLEWKSFGNPMFFLAKKDGKLCMCIDNRVLIKGPLITWNFQPALFVGQPPHQFRPHLNPLSQTLRLGG